MSEPTTAIHCPNHGESHATFVCVHLATSDGRGFYYAASPDDPRPDAWCYDCDLGLLKEGEWTERLEEAAQITILCAGCYDTVRERNQAVRPNFELDGWKLGEVAELDPPIPIHELPPAKEKRKLRAGDLVKLLFLLWMLKTVHGLEENGCGFGFFEKLMRALSVNLIMTQEPKVL